MLSITILVFILIVRHGEIWLPLSFFVAGGVRVFRRHRHVLRCPYVLRGTEFGYKVKIHMKLWMLFIPLCRQDKFETFVLKLAKKKRRTHQSAGDDDEI